MLAPRTVVAGPGMVVAGAIAAALLAPLLSPAFGQDRPERSVPDLKTVSPDQRVRTVTYCRGHYDVSLGDGSRRVFREYDLAFKTDTSPSGPRPSEPAIVPTGRVGDRALIIFATLDELRGFVTPSC